MLLFGLPIVLNPLMFIPFLLTPLLLAGISYVAVVSGLVPGTSVQAEWTTPILLNGYLSTGSLSGSVLQLFNIVIGVFLYAPFVLLSNKIKVNRSTTPSEACCGVPVPRRTLPGAASTTTTMRGPSPAS